MVMSSIIRCRKRVMVSSCAEVEGWETTLMAAQAAGDVGPIQET